jgi:hypothetical protein
MSEGRKGPADYVMVYVDDWAGLYQDGVCVTQHHEVELHTFVKFVLERPIKSFKERWADDAWVSDLGGLPEKLEDVKWERRVPFE